MTTAPAEHAERFPAFGQAKTLKEWAGDRHCAVAEETLARRVAEGWDFEFALVTVDRADADLAGALLAVPARGAERPATLDERMEQVRVAASDSASATEIARQLRITSERVRQIIVAMPDGPDIRKTIERNRRHRAAQRAAARTRTQARPRRAPFTPDPEELAELRRLVPVAARLRGGFGVDSPARTAAVRRDEIASSWRSRGASIPEIARFAGVTPTAVGVWTDPARKRSRQQGPQKSRFAPPPEELAELGRLVEQTLGRARHDAQRSLAAARRDAMIKDWRNRGASRPETAELAGVSLRSIDRWLSPQPDPAPARPAAPPGADSSEPPFPGGPTPPDASRAPSATPGPAAA